MRSSEASLDSELARFHSNPVGPETHSFATYLVSGELFPQLHAKPNGATQLTEDNMDVDSEATGHVEDEDENEDDEEEVPITTMILVGEKDLEGTSDTNPLR